MPKGKFFEEHGITRVGKILRDAKQLGVAVAPELLELTTGIPAVGVIKKVVEMVRGGKTNLPADVAQNLIEASEFDLAELAAHERLIAGHQDLEKTQLNSDDKFTRRARPTRQYFWLLVMALALLVWPVWKGHVLEIPTEFLVLMGGDMGVYALGRTAEKMGKGKGLLSGLLKR